MISTIQNGPNHTLIHIDKSDTTQIQIGPAGQQQWTGSLNNRTRKEKQQAVQLQPTI
jgi:hypothetical protein